MKNFIFILLFLTACSQSETPSNFKVKSPKASSNTSHNKWQKHVSLPTFDAEKHSDGCSGGMSAMYAKMTFLHKNHNNKLRWHECCVIHDKAYYYGGTKQEKKQADKALSQCVSKVVGNKFLGKAMQLAVKIGGSPYLPTSYRWGYGEDFREDFSIETKSK